MLQRLDDLQILAQGLNIVFYIQVCLVNLHAYCLSELLMRIKTSGRNICQHNYYRNQHCHFVNSTQVSNVIKRLCVGKSDRIDH